ncbi:MAG: transcriptional repressor LexA [Fibromonadales bacterium]|nr:transcriptional repressor LexA [Fibromonadales bacterium]
MKELTDRQRAIYGYIKDFILSHKYPPTIREIGARFNIKSTNGVRDALKALEIKGYIKKRTNRARGIELPKKVFPSSAHTAHLPVIGSIAAGTPILAQENIEETLTIDQAMLPRNSEIFALRVQGDSMTGDGILSGDIAIIRMQKNAERGQIVAAIIDGDATLKHYHPSENKIELRASNPKYFPITVSEGEDFSIAGILAGVIRKC